MKDRLEIDMAKILATFRLEENDWKDFHHWAIRQGSTTTTELTGFVMGKLGRLDIPIPLDSPELDEKLNTLIDEKLDERMTSAYLTFD